MLTMTTAQSSLLMTHESRLTAEFWLWYSQLTANDSSLTTHETNYIAHDSRNSVHDSQLTAYDSRVTAHEILHMIHSQS